MISPFREIVGIEHGWPGPLVVVAYVFIGNKLWLLGFWCIDVHNHCEKKRSSVNIYSKSLIKQELLFSRWLYVANSRSQEVSFSELCSLT